MLVVRRPVLLLCSALFVFPIAALALDKDAQLYVEDVIHSLQPDDALARTKTATARQEALQRLTLQVRKGVPVSQPDDKLLQQSERKAGKPEFRANLVQMMKPELQADPAQFTSTNAKTLSRSVALEQARELTLALMTP